MHLMLSYLNGNSEVSSGGFIWGLNGHFSTAPPLGGSHQGLIKAVEEALIKRLLKIQTFSSSIFQELSLE